MRVLASIPPSLRRHLAPLAVATTGFACALAAALAVQSVIREREDLRWTEIADANTLAVVSRMDHYTAALRAAGGFVEALGRDPTVAEFRAFVDAQALRSEFPGIQGIGWARAIAPQELPQLVRTERAGGNPAFRVWPEGARPFYSSILRLEPLDWRNRRAIGYDMFAEPVRRAAMERARDQRAPATSGRVELVQEAGAERQAGFLVYLPVFAHPLEAVTGHTAPLRGWVYAPFRAADLFRNALGESRFDDVRLEVYDGAEVGEEHRLYADPGTDRGVAFREARIQVGGRVWTLRFAALTPLSTAFERAIPAGVLLLGFALTLLLAWITRAESLGRARAERTARRNALLAEAGRELAASLDYGATLGRVARLAAAGLADAAAVLLLEPEGPRWTVAHADPARAAELDAALRRAMAQPGADRAVAALAERHASLHVGVAPDRVSFLARSPPLLAAVRAAGLDEALSVPLHARGEPLGAIVLLSGAPRRLGAEDLAAAEDLGRMASGTIDTSRLFRRAQAAVEARDEFLSIASHELKTPITSLALQSDSLRSAARRGDLDGLVRKTDVIRRNVDRLARLVASLLDLTRISAGRLELELEQVDLADVAREVAARFEEEASRAGCTLRVDAPAPVRGRWDRLRVDQVVTNLLANAVKYGAGKPIELCASGDGERATLAVVDHGIGIPLEDQPRIFGRFERAVSKRNYGGFGLGLWIVREIVDALGGAVRVESAPGKGSTFTVELPTHPAAADPVALEAEQPASPGR